MEYNGKIDGFNVTDIQTKNTSKNRTKDLTITYYCNGEKYVDSLRYEGVTEEKIKKVKDKLFEYALYNLNCEKMSEVIPLFTIISEVERIIYD